MLELTLGRNVRKRLLPGDTTDPSSDKEPVQAVTGELIPSYAKRRAAWSRKNLGTEFEIPWASACVLHPLHVSPEQVVSGELPGLRGKRGISHHLTSHQNSKPNLALWILLRVKEL